VPAWEGGRKVESKLELESKLAEATASSGCEPAWSEVGSVPSMSSKRSSPRENSARKYLNRE